MPRRVHGVSRSTDCPSIQEHCLILAVPAVYHNDLREFLIEEWNRRGTYGKSSRRSVENIFLTLFRPTKSPWNNANGYNLLPPRTEGLVGTIRCSGPSHPLTFRRGGSREHRPKILFQILFDETKPRTAIDKKAEKAPVWYQGNRIVLDGDNHPVRQYTEIPAVCSSEMEGWLMVAIRRLNPSITTQDLRARMPHFRTLKSNGEGERKQWSLQAHSMRQTRFQFKAGCLALEPRAGSDTIKKYLMDLLPAHCKARNSTEGFRDLTDTEVEAMKSANKGGFSYRGKRKAQLEEGASSKKMKRTCMNEAGSGHTDSKEHDELSIKPEGGRYGQIRSSGWYDTDYTRGRPFNHTTPNETHVGVVGHEVNVLPYKENTGSSKEERTIKRKRIWEDDSGNLDKDPSKAPKRQRRASPIAAIETHGHADNPTLRFPRPLTGHETGRAPNASELPAWDDLELYNEAPSETVQLQTFSKGTPPSDPVLGGYENEDAPAVHESTEPREDFLTTLYFELLQDETQDQESLAENKAEATEENVIDQGLLHPAFSGEETSARRALPQQADPAMPISGESAVAEGQGPASPPAVQSNGSPPAFLDQLPNGYFDSPLSEVDFFDEAYGSIYGAFIRND